MSVSLVRLRKRAAELEQKKQFDRALEVYVQILDEGGKDLDDEDVPLFNRVGDMLMRKGSVTEALGYYERAVDMYAERGYLNNAIALCSKILRQSPGRAAVYYKLARISAKKGFKSDARKNFLEYADRMQKLGMADEAFRALKEFASLYPDQDDVRLVLAELLSKENRKGEAIEQLQSLYEKLQSEGRAAEARATIDRMRAIDPSVTPREGTATQTPSAGDLVFLDLTAAEQPGQKPRTGDTAAQPASARAPVKNAVPALNGLSITFFPDETETARPEGFEPTAVEAEPVETSPVTRSLTPAGSELVIEPQAPPTSEPVVEATEPFEMIGNDPPVLERVEHLVEELLPDLQDDAEQLRNLRTPAPLSGHEFADLELDALTHEYETPAHDLALPGRLPGNTEEFSVPTTTDEFAVTATPDETVAVPTPDETVAAVTPDETVTVPTPGKAFAVQVPDEPDPVKTPEDIAAMHFSPASAAAAEDARAAAEEAADLAADIAAREAVHQGVRPVTPAPVTEPDELPAASSPPLESADAAELDVPSRRESTEIPDDFLAMPPSFGASPELEEDHAFPPLFGLDESTSGAQASIAEEAEPVPAPRLPTPRGTISIGSAESHLRSRLELDPENCDLRRQLGEALLDTGDRDGGLYELELAMVGFELRGDLDRAQEVVDLILRVSPGSVAHHQKRVEYAVRSRDRGRLTHSYLELADALFRTGAADKAVAVYSRVLELDRNNERAEFALATLAPDDLVRLRGVPARPDRWTDELVALSDNGRPESQAAPVADVVAHEQVLEERPAPDEARAEAPMTEPAPRTRFRSLELPVPDWDEGVSGKVDEVRAAPQETMAQHDESTLEAIDLDVDEADERDTALSSPVTLESEEETLVNEALADVVPTPRSETPIAVPATRQPTPLSAPITRPPTPLATPAASPRPALQRDVPAGDSDSEFVDLGDWLRRTEPTRSTRMQVEDPKPTGDEQADFEEMLRRFKRGVAENVEAEDYEAHYDLGVAYKEMGLVDEAIAQFQKSLRDPDQRVRSYEALGQCFVEKKQYPIAAALLKRATEVPGSDDQQLVGVLYLLGFATEHLGRPSEALPYYLRVFAVDIEFRDIAERVAALGNHTT
jgi:tetratricopeptide (TPR) repeat protein